MTDNYGNYIAGLVSSGLETPPGSGGVGGSGTTSGLHGNGAPAAGLGDSGNTYVDDVTGQLYWKSATLGWQPAP